MAGDDRQYMTEGQMRWKGLKIAVVEDDTVHAAVLTRYLETWMQGRNIAFCIRKFPDAAAFLFEWEQDQAWNALFFDIQMPGLNGVELAKKSAGRTGGSRSSLSRESQITFWKGMRWKHCTIW